MEETLYDKYGQVATIRKIVQDFYKRVLISPLLKDYFKGVDIVGLIDHQVQFVSQIMGGPGPYKGKSLKDAHKGLKVTDEAYDEVIAIFRDVLKDAGVTPEDNETIAGKVEAYRSQILS